jgi:hypothetical protein
MATKKEEFKKESESVYLQASIGDHLAAEVTALI